MMMLEDEELFVSDDWSVFKFHLEDGGRAEQPGAGGDWGNDRRPAEAHETLMRWRRKRRRGEAEGGRRSR